MYTVWLVNFGHFASEPQNTFAGAMAVARRTGLECCIRRDSVPIGVWSILGGYRAF